MYKGFTACDDRYGLIFWVIKYAIKYIYLKKISHTNNKQFGKNVKFVE